MRVEFTFDSRDVQEFLASKASKALNQSIARTLRRSATSVQSRIVKLSTKELNLKRGDVVDAVSTSARLKGNDSPKQIILYVWERPIRLFKFDARWTTKEHGARVSLGARRTLRAGKYEVVTAEVKRGQRKLVQGGFIGNMRNNGRLTIFKRKTSKRFPLENLRSLSVRQIIDRETVLNELHTLAHARFKAEFDRNLAYYMNKV